MQLAGVLLIALVATLASFQAQAATPAPMAQPPACVRTTDGQSNGTCFDPSPANSPGYSLSAGGSVGAGGTITLRASPGVPVCNSHTYHQSITEPETWSPSPCFESVSLGLSNACYYIDLRDGQFKYGQCLDVLYKNRSPYSSSNDDLVNGPSLKSLFTYQSQDQYAGYTTPGCYSNGNLSGFRYPLPEYPYDGSGGDKPPWSDRIPAALNCAASYTGRRPDGLYGPTWVVADLHVSEGHTIIRGAPYYPPSHQVNILVPISGDLRNPGVIADFDAEVLGRKASFTNKSMAANSDELTFKWNFGDNESATARNPTHVYESGGTYTVSLTARDANGSENTKTKQVEAETALIVELVAPEPIPKVGEQADIQVNLQNYETSDIRNLTLDLALDSSRLKNVGFPPPVPTSLAKNTSTTVSYTVEALAAGDATFNANAEGRTAEGRPVTGSDSGSIRIPVNIALELSSAVKSDPKAKPKIGDDIQFVLKLTNNEKQTLTRITVEPLGIMPNRLSTVSGPTTEGGQDPRVNRLSLAPGESTTVTFVYHAEQKGVVHVSAFVAGKNPSGNGIFTAGTDRDIGIQAGVDVAVSVEANLDQADFDNGRLFASYDVTIDNVGDADAENLTLTATFPEFLSVQSVTEPQCLLPNVNEGVTPPAADKRIKAGGQLQCNFDRKLAVDSSRKFTVKARIVNATDLNALQTGFVLQNSSVNKLRGVRFIVKADDDIDPDNNKTDTKVDIPFRNGSFDQTRAAMEALAPYFNYMIKDHFGQACNNFKDDIFARLQAIRSEHPEVFARISYGSVTSGDYYNPIGAPFGFAIAGHVGVVVYTKGTDYRKTGIIINGTPSPSSLNAVSEIGPNDPGDGFGVAGFTALNGLYLRTPADKYPGTPQPEGASGIGFEGEYPDNEAEFTYGGLPPTQAIPLDMTTCPFAPDAVTVMTQSPVDLRVTNGRGQQVETSGGQIARQDLDNGIVAMAFPEGDGTFSWLLDLPRDNYSIELLGIGSGPYTLTTTRFRADGTPVATVINGQTQPDQLDTFQFDAASAPAGQGGGDSGSAGANANGSRTAVGRGGCSMSTTPGAADPTLPMLALLAGLVLMRRRLRAWLQSQERGRPRSM